MKYVVAYDIRDSKRRVKVFKLLKGYGYNVQKSVFEIFVENNSILKELIDEINNLINLEEDVVYIFPYYDKPITNESYKNFFKREVSF